MTQLSIVTTMYCSEQYVEQFYQRSILALQKLGISDYEFVLVDDGSPDNSLHEAVNLIKTDANVKVIELSRNFGHHKAIITGLENATGENIFLIDIDLEEAPELLEVFWAEIHARNNADVDVVYGVQKSRKGGWFERWSGNLYFDLFNLLSDDVVVKKNLSTVRIMKRKYVEALMKYKEEEFHLGPVCSLVGFKQIPLSINKVSHSDSTYNVLKKYNLLINSIFSFSKKPLYFIFYSGLLMTLLSFSVGGVILIQKLLNDTVLDGWTSVMVSIWFLSGIIILFLGTIATYLARIFDETKKRPFTVIKTVYRKE